MAEIKIEKKKQGWTWLLVGLLIAALIIYFLLLGDNGKNTDVEIITKPNSVSDTNENNLLSVKENNITVAAFISFVENNTGRISFDYTYTKEAFLKLTTATDAMADEIGYDIRVDLDKVKESATLIANEPFETSQAKNIRIATDNSTTALQNMQLAKYPWLTDEVEELRNASTLINPEVLISGQKDAIMNYFAKAADLLQKMN